MPLPKPPVCLDVFRADSADGESVQRFDTTPLPPVRRTPEDYLLAPGTRIARVGVQEYRTEDGVELELRLPEHVFDPESLASLNGKPLTRGHHGRVDASNARQVMRGVAATGRKDASDERFVASDLTVHDGNLIREAERGDAREVSAGYTTRRMRIPGGVYRKDGCPFDGTRADWLQTRIRYNHIALLPAGRANEGMRDRPVSLRLDGAGNQLTEQEQPKMITVKVDGKDVEMTEAGAAAYNAAVKRADEAETSAKKADEKQVTTAADDKHTTELAAATKRADEAEAKLKEQADEANSGDKAKAAEELFDLRKKAESETKLDKADVLKLDAAGLRAEILKAVDSTITEDELKDDAFVRASLRLRGEKRDSSNRLRDPTRTDGVDKGDKPGETREDASPLTAAYNERDKRNAATRNRAPAK